MGNTASIYLKQTVCTLTLLENRKLKCLHLKILKVSLDPFDSIMPI